VGGPRSGCPRPSAAGVLLRAEIIVERGLPWASLPVARPTGSQGGHHGGALRLDDDAPDQAGHADRLRAAWRPDTHPEGMLRAYAYWSEDEREIVGVSFWDSKQSCEAWRASTAAARRREAMAAYILGEQEVFYRGRELHLPDH
jgi:heme-degrading monooxygenase HmoA